MSTYTVRYNRTTNHIDGIGARTTGGGNESGGVVSYYAVSACGSLTRGATRMAVSKSFDSLADALEFARTLSGRKLCKSCEKAAVAQLAAEAEEVERRKVAEGAPEPKADALYGPIWDAEQAVRGERASAEFGINAGTRERARRHLKAAQEKLYALIDSLTVDELREYVAYRRAILEAHKAERRAEG